MNRMKLLVVFTIDHETRMVSLDDNASKPLSDLLIVTSDQPPFSTIGSTDVSYDTFTFLTSTSQCLRM